MKKNKEVLYTTRVLLGWLWRTSRAFRLQAGINSLLGVAEVGLDFAFIWATKLAVDTATGSTGGSLMRAAVCLVAIVAMQIGLGLTSKWVGVLLGVKARNDMRQRLFRHLLDCRWHDGKHRHSGDVLNRLEQDVADVVSILTETLPDVLTVLLRLAGAFVFLFCMDRRLACIVVVVVPLFIVLSRLYVRKMRSLTRDVRQTDSRIQSLLQEGLRHRTLIKTLERTGLLTERLDAVQAYQREQIKRRTYFSSFSSTVLNLGFATGYMVTFLWGAYRLQDGLITYGTLLAFIQLVGQIQGPFRDLTRFVPLLVGALTASERLKELEDLPLETCGTPVRMNGPAGIRLRGVGYAYPPDGRPVLHRLTYDFPPGSRTAILGETGAGKTTLIRLILALLEPQEGAVEIYDGGGAVKCSSLTRCNLVYVPQGNTLFSGTIRDNLLLGDPEATEERMRRALHDACADFVWQLPLALDTRCGEGGDGLSEGQAQRIALARALLRPGGILLLDEATSALDEQTERQLLDNLSRILDGRTLLFITHRPSVVAHCTQVLRLEKTNAG